MSKKEVKFSPEALVKEANKNLLLLTRGFDEAKSFSIQELLNDGADINHRDKYGNTPLIIAAFNGRMELVRELVENNADLSLRDNQGDTAQTAAASNGKTGVAEFLAREAEENSKDRPKQVAQPAVFLKLKSQEKSKDGDDLGGISSPCVIS